MTVCQKKWRAVLLQVRTNGLAKYYNISRQGGRGNCRLGSDHFFYKIYYNKNIKTKRLKTVCE